MKIIGKIFIILFSYCNYCLALSKENTELGNSFKNSENDEIVNAELPPWLVFAQLVNDKLENTEVILNGLKELAFENSRIIHNIMNILEISEKYSNCSQKIPNESSTQQNSSNKISDGTIASNEKSESPENTVTDTKPPKLSSVLKNSLEQTVKNRMEIYDESVLEMKMKKIKEEIQKLLHKIKSGKSKGAF
ncbi:UNVERIFIED_CONTAM: hypothetical protein RMT77_008382 [Armadillidium vulgare]